ncbi:MAG: type I 3-dehydroquinate dehydratase [Lachnospiraceae bacterium]|nr:type I 3-dehydroquinate dehydratase [Lachnospiraceae bacterium]
MTQVKIGKTILGDGRTKIAVPIVGRNNVEIEEQIFNNAKHTPDLIEIRADYYESLFEKGKLINMLENAKKLANDIPILFTIRTKNEGGEIAINYELYSDLLISVAMSGFVDAVDVEGYFKDDVKPLIANLKSHNVVVIASYHNFESTPGQTELVMKLGKLMKTGADVVKLAVMPNSPRDVLNLMEATLGTEERYPDTPMITMSMGPLGMISRIGGAAFGSCLSFANAGKASAPGQLEIEELRSLVNQMS